MDHRRTKFTARLSSTVAITVALGLLLWAVIAYAATSILFYNDASFSSQRSLPPKYGRDNNDIPTEMSGGFGGSTYSAEYWGPSTDYGTDLVNKPLLRNPAITENPPGNWRDVVLQSEIASENPGMWQVRYHHNPQYGLAGTVVIDSPLPGDTVAPGSTLTVQFHLEDRDGNVITTDNTNNLAVLFKDGGSTIWRNKSPDPPVVHGKNTKPGWNFSNGYWTYDDGSGSYTVAGATDQVIELTVFGKGGVGDVAEPGDTYALGAITATGYAKIGNPPTPDTSAVAYAIVPAAGMDEHFVGNPGSQIDYYHFYFDILDDLGNPITPTTDPSYNPTWITRAATEAMDYDANTLQSTITGQIYRPGETPLHGTADPNHWQWEGTVGAPGKYLLKLKVNGANNPEVDYVFNFGTTEEFELSADMTPPAEVTAFSATPGDNTAAMSWTNPGDADFAGVLIAQSFNTFGPTDAPENGKPYDTKYAPGSNPTVVGTADVVYNSNGTSFTDGQQCSGLTNNTPHYYKAFTYDTNLNYSPGVEIVTTPFDTTPPGQVTGVYVVAGDQKNTIHWTNPSDCDITQVLIRYRTDGTFPSASNGSEPGGKVSYEVGTTTPSGAGLPDSYTDNSLTNGTPYYYTIWIGDNDGNWNNDVGAGAPEAQSPPSEATPHDTTPPAQISDLTVVGGSVDAFSATLQWTAVDEDNGTGSKPAAKYEIRYSDHAIVTDGYTGSDWDTAWKAVGEDYPAPDVPGNTQTYTVAGLSPLSTYHFAMKVIDEAGNESVKSSGDPTADTLCNEELSACNQCHLLPPNDDLPGAHPRGTGNIGDHDLPIHASANPEQCNVCHANGQVFDEISGKLLYQFNHQNDVIDMNPPKHIGNLKERLEGNGGTFNQTTTTVYKYKNYSSGVGYKMITGRCENTYCHGAGLSSPRWGMDKIVCGEYCHETPPATGRHVKHYHPGQHYVNFAPGGTLVSGYDNDDGTVGWTDFAGGPITPTMVNRGSRVFTTATTTVGNNDQRYATFMETTEAEKEFLLPDGTWYITVCLGDPDGPATGQTVQISGKGGGSNPANWETIVDNFDTTPGKLFKKVVDHKFIVTAGQNLKIRLGNGADLTKLNFMIVNGTEEAPKKNETILKNTPSEYGFSCGKCHVMDTSQARHTEHVKGPVLEGYRDAEVAFDVKDSYPRNPFGLYTNIDTGSGFANISSKIDGQGYRYTTGHYCVNLYCHGSTLNANGSNHTPQWKDGYIDVTGADLCGACHDAGYADTTPYTNISTGSHHRHVSKDYPYNFDCAKCHHHTVGFTNKTTGEIAIIDKTHHVNGDVDVVFDENDKTMKLGNYSTGNKTCYQVYCHSNGLLNPAGEPASYTRYRTPQWGTGPWTCDYCHGTNDPSGYREGMPWYFSTASTLNSHEMHVVENHQGCSMCHYDTTRDNGKTIHGTYSTLHVNGDRDVTFSALNSDRGAWWDEGSHRCMNTYCHSITSPPTWGGTATCGSCHGDKYDNPNTGIGAHNKHTQGNHGNISTISANNSTQGQYDFDCRFCHFSRTHGGGPADDTPPIEQVAEVNFNTIDVTNAYNNTGAYYRQGFSQYSDTNRWKWTNGKCYNVLCHSDGRGGMPNNTSFTWGDASGSLGCYGCHGGGYGAPAGKRINSYNHPKHVWSSVYQKDCQACHEPTATLSNQITDRRMHVNGRPDVGLSVVWHGTYDDVDKTCSNVDCHSNHNPSEWNGPGSVYYVTMNWTTTVPTTCTTCHSNDYYPGGDPNAPRAANQTLSFNHRKHVSSTANGGYGSRFGCPTCHHKTAQSNFAIRTTIPTHHNNQTVDIAYYVDFFNMTGAFSTTPGGGYWGNFDDPDRGNCTVICHSKPSPFVGNNNITSITDPIRFPNWSSVNYGCGGCHGDKNTLTSGSHVKHAQINNIDCGACHGLTAKADRPLFDGQQEISDSGYTTYHINLTKDVSMAATVGGSWTYDGLGGPTDETCTTNNGSCHKNGSPKWGTVGTCVDCHMDSGAVGSEVDDFTFGNGTSASINQTEYDSVGHGFSNLSTYAISNNPGANLDCTTNCHDDSVGHNVSTNPFRLQNPDTNALCTGCHSTSLTNHHNKTNTGGDSLWSWTPKCIDCHDPHGDYSDQTGRVNRYMIQGYVNYSSSDYGIPAATMSVGFPDNGGGAEPGSLDQESFVQSDFTGLCQVCHPPGGSAASHPNNFSQNLYNTGHSGGSACTDCHLHSTGFQGNGNCNSCHSDQGAGSNLTHSYTGKHLAHTNSSGYVLACENCHTWYSPTATVSHKMGPVSADQTAEVIFRTSTTVWKNIQYEGAGTTFKYIGLDSAYGLTGITPAYQAWTTLTDLTDPVNSTREWTEGRCSNIWCHSNANPLGGTMLYAQFPNWSTAETVTCTSCHGGPGATGTMSAAHAKHIDTYSFACSECHHDTVFSGSTQIGDKSMHVNGAKNVAFDPSGRNPSGGYASPPTCTGLSCHGNGTGGTGSVDWNAGSLGCDSCHYGLKSDTNTIQTGTHTAHVDNATDPNLGSFTCDNCHFATMTNGSTITTPSNHDNGSPNVQFAAGGSWSGTNCSGTACHTNGAASSPTDLNPAWGGAAIGCNGCHGTDNYYTDINGSPDYQNTGPNPNSHYVFAHVSSAGSCINCHNSTVDAAGNIKSNSLHLDGSPSVDFLNGGSWNGSTCSGVSCHPNITPTWGGTLTCYDCHVVTGTETDDYVYGNAPSGMATINEGQWLNAGHGRTGTNYPYTNSAPANFPDCTTNCHTYSIDHNDGSDPFRLVSSATIMPSDVSTLCTSCHSTSSTNHHSFAVVLANMPTADATWTFTPKCIDCHDPHGDNGGITTTNYNAAMIHSAPYTTGSNGYGVPNGTTATDFPYDWGGSLTYNSFIDTTNPTPYNGLCQICHIDEDGAGPQTTADHFNTQLADTGPSGHNDGQMCLSCHTHDKGFAGAGCNGCHGDPPNITDNKQDNVGAVGAHDLHVNTLSMNCAECHGHNGSGSQHNETGAMAGYSSIIPPANVDVDLSTAPAYHGVTPTYNGTPGSWATNKTCSNVGCHFGVSKDWDCQ